MQEKMLRWHYWNANGFAIAIVASISMWPNNNSHDDHKPFDWACYIGATEGTRTLENETVEFVHKHGCKLSYDEACAFFPHFAKITYRS